MGEWQSPTGTNLCLADELVIFVLRQCQPGAEGHGLALAVLQAALQQLRLHLQLGELVCLVADLQDTVIQLN
jgi:hypothetical protein